MTNKLYEKSPRLGRNANGKLEVQRADAEKMDEEKKEDGGLPMHARQQIERRDMHGRHEMEHAMHDYTGSGDKKQLHARHEKEMADMHARHEKEMSDSKGER
jgi:hypothetical protein